MSYQASSPDEVALVQWSEEMGLALIERTLTSMKLRTPEAEVAGYSILQIFPFTSETKRMGIIVKDEKTNEIIVYMKGELIVIFQSRIEKSTCSRQTAQNLEQS